MRWVRRGRVRRIHVAGCEEQALLTIAISNLPYHTALVLLSRGGGRARIKRLFLDPLALFQSLKDHNLAREFITGLDLVSGLPGRGRESSRGREAG